MRGERGSPSAIPLFAPAATWASAVGPARGPAAAAGGAPAPGRCRCRAPGEHKALPSPAFLRGSLRRNKEGEGPPCQAPPCRGKPRARHTAGAPVRRAGSGEVLGQDAVCWVRVGLSCSPDHFLPYLGNLDFLLPFVPYFFFSCKAVSPGCIGNSCWSWSWGAGGGLCLVLSSLPGSLLSGCSHTFSRTGTAEMDPAVRSPDYWGSAPGGAAAATFVPGVPGEQREWQSVP